MKQVMTLLLASVLVFGAAQESRAVEFKATGEWLFGVGAINSTFVTKKDGRRTPASADDRFTAMQRLRTWLEFSISESLSGTVNLEIGDTAWGSAQTFGGGGALGTDGTIVKVRRAYLDWVFPDAPLKFRMGIQGMILPAVAGGSSILDADTVGIVANYTFNQNVGLSGVWVRPYNDNYISDNARNPTNYLDNVDLFMLSLPLSLPGWKLTPWAMLGVAGKNYYLGSENAGNLKGGDFFVNTMPYTLIRGEINGNASAPHSNSNAYGNIFFAGLPLAITAFEDWNIELDINYGYSQGLGRYNITNYADNLVRRADTKREGWLVKALVEYKMDWGTPGILGWYASGDDGNVKNGSERMPAISPCNNFTSFIGDDYVAGLLLSGKNQAYDLQMTYAGTWGIGVQLKDVISFMDNLKHTLRVVHWGGTNSPSMIKYLSSTDAGESTVRYLTTKDSLLEFNLDSTYKFYENLDLVVELGYIVNGIDKSAWNGDYRGNSSFQKGNAYKAAAIMKYTF